MLSEDCQQGATDECDVGQEIGITAPGAVLTEDDIAPPMVADLNARPVPANEPQPLRRAVLLGQCAGEIVVRFGGALVGFFDAPGVAQHD